MGERFRRGYPQAPDKAVIAPGNVAAKRQHLVLHALACGGHPPGQGCRLIGTAGKALEQLLAEPRLDRLQAPERGGVIDPERSGSTDQALRADHREHQPQLVPVIGHRLRSCK